MKWGDLVFNEREGVFYKKFTDVPFSGTVTGSQQGKLKNGKWDGPWVSYWENGQLWDKGTFMDGEREGPWVSYRENGQLSSKGTYKDGKKEGPWVRYFEDGTVNKKLTGTFKDGKLVK